MTRNQEACDNLGKHEKRWSEDFEMPGQMYACNSRPYKVSMSPSTSSSLAAMNRPRCSPTRGKDGSYVELPVRYVRPTQSAPKRPRELKNRFN